MLALGDLVLCAVGPTVYIYEPFSFECQGCFTTQTGADVTSLAGFETKVLVGTADGAVEWYDSVRLNYIASFPLGSSRVGVAALAAVTGDQLRNSHRHPVCFAASTAAAAIDVWSMPN